MLVYKPPVDDITFLLETFGYEDIVKYDGFADFDMDVARAILESAGDVCVTELLPQNAAGDQTPLGFDPETGDVTVAPGFKKAYKALAEAGLIGLGHEAEFGGMGAPHMLAFMASEFVTATNKSLSMAPALGHGLIASLTHYGSDEQKAMYLEKLITGEWTGTMCLTEPQCGTDLGLITTKAIPQDDNSYLLTGTKIWITFGDHDLADNIIHLVLAKMPDSPPGIKGISAFLVPKFLEDGTRNPVKVTGLEHKMGIHGSPTCVMALEDARGWLVGAPHKGMRAMFKMMNAARLGVGIEGYALSEIAYQSAVAFAQERRQMRALNPERRDRSQAADCILVHPDIRRLLAGIKCTNEGMRALGAFVAGQLDIAQHDPDEKKREAADDVVQLLTPVVKAYCTERGFANISDAMQVCGGAGYTRDWPIEQYMRDQRIAMIYEGTNHIQALDLVGRKLPLHGGRLVRRFAGLVTETIRSCGGDERLADLVDGLKSASKALTTATMELAQKGMKDPEEAAAVATPYLNLFGLTALALVWVEMAKAAIDREGKFYETKVKMARFYIHNVLPEMHGILATMKAGKRYMMDIDADEF